MKCKLRILFTIKLKIADSAGNFSKHFPAIIFRKKSYLLNYKKIFPHSMKKIGILFLMTCGYFHASSQQIYDSLLNELYVRYPQEKIYIQMDKSYYNKGETIWFKAYIFTGHVPSLISKTIYAELINEQGAVLQRKTMPVVQAGAASHFDLPDSNRLSKLYIRAYTSWMLNFDSTSLYLQPVNMIGAATKKIKAAASYTLSLFPEGGDLIDNIESRIAFKTNDQDGKPFAVKGSITDARGKTLGSFSSTHNGMGYFNILVTSYEKYIASWKDPDGQQHQTALPDVKKQGAALKIRTESGKLFYTLVRPENASDDFKEYAVIAQMQQQTVYAARLNLRVKTTVTATLTTDSLPDGIMQITVFNKMQVPVAERIVFINNNSYSFITDLHLVEKNIKARGKNVLQVDVGGTYKSNLSVAVTDAGLNVSEGPAENIFSKLLLTADLKGHVYNPAYYFSSDEDSVKQQLDLVMLTNGWRRFKWEAIIANQWPVIKHSPENYLSIQGNIFGLSSLQLSDKTLTGILQASENSGKSFLTIPVNKDGSFKLSGVYFFDTLRLFYQFNNDKNKVLTSTASFSFNNGLIKSPLVSMQELSALYWPPEPAQDIALKSIKQHDLLQYQIKGQKIKILETVTVMGKKISLAETLDKEYASGLFRSGNAKIFVTADDPFAQSSISVLDYLRGKVAGLQISTNGADGGSITRRGSNTDVFLNEMSTDIGLLQSTPMTDVAMIKVFDPPFFGASGGGAGGAVAVYTKKGTGGNTRVQGLNSTTLHGYSAIKEFYVPDYEINNTSEPADYRSTLYWNPFLLMDAKNKRVTIPFYNNDNGQKIRVVIEGLNEAGQLTREEKFFE